MRRNNLIVLLLWLLFAAPVVSAADAPDHTIRIAAISALPATALPKTRAGPADIHSHASIVGVGAPQVAARPAAIPQHDAAPGNAATPARGVLDLRAPDLWSMPWSVELLTTVPEQSDEPQAVAVLAAALPPDETSDTNLSLAGIGSLYWAARHPLRAWRVLLPVEANDEFGAYAGLRTKCAVLPSALSAHAAVPVIQGC